MRFSGERQPWRFDIDLSTDANTLIAIWFARANGKFLTSKDSWTRISDHREMWRRVMIVGVSMYHAALSLDHKWEMNLLERRVLSVWPIQWSQWRVPIRYVVTLPNGSWSLQKVGWSFTYSYAEGTQSVTAPGSGITRTVSRWLKSDRVYTNGSIANLASFVPLKIFSLGFWQSFFIFKILIHMRLVL